MADKTYTQFAEAYRQKYITKQSIQSRFLPLKFDLSGLG